MCNLVTKTERGMKKPRSKVCAQHVRSSLPSGGSTVDAGVTGVNPSDFIISALRRQTWQRVRFHLPAAGKIFQLCLSEGTDDRERDNTNTTKNTVSEEKDPKCWFYMDSIWRHCHFGAYYNSVHRFISLNSRVVFKQKDCRLNLKNKHKQDSTWP